MYTLYHINGECGFLDVEQLKLDIKKILDLIWKDTLYTEYPSDFILCHPLSSKNTTFKLFVKTKDVTTMGNSMLIASYLRRLFAFYSSTGTLRCEVLDESDKGITTIIEIQHPKDRVVDLKDNFCYIVYDKDYTRY